LGFLGEGQAALERALELDPMSVEAWVNLGGARLARWDFAGCVEANQRALDCRPGLIQAHFNQGLGYMYLGDAERMVACFEKVLDLDSANPGGHYYLAVGLRDLGQIGEARTYLAKAVGLGHSPDPSFVKALEQDEKPSQNSVQILEFGPHSEEAETDKDE
jgi:tetratricopeptide (TPR) repeat protein